MSGCRVKQLVFATGERFSVLVDSEGMPVFTPTVYAVSVLRGRNAAARTIDNAIRAISVLYVFLNSRGIDLEARISKGQLFTPGELDELCRSCRSTLSDLKGHLEHPSGKQVQRRGGGLEQKRMRLSEKHQNQVSVEFASTRIQAIRDYLLWVLTVRSANPNMSDQHRNLLSSVGIALRAAMTARMPAGRMATQLDRREGLAEATSDELLRVIEPSCPDNPWSDEHGRYRNRLAIKWLLHLGIRRGELLGIRVPDIDFRKGTVTIARRPDNPKDPRKAQPTAKTLARELPLSEFLLEDAKAYILTHRANLRGARKHDYLFVASDSGAPLSIPALAKVFTVLRERCSSLPADLTPHVLRHTWNDRFSEDMDSENTEAESEKKLRSYLMGWSTKSDTAATYTRRHIRRKALDASLSLQEKALNPRKPPP